MFSDVPAEQRSKRTPVLTFSRWEESRGCTCWFVAGDDLRMRSFFSESLEAARHARVEPVAALHQHHLPRHFPRRAACCRASVPRRFSSHAPCRMQPDKETNGAQATDREPARCPGLDRRPPARVRKRRFSERELTKWNRRNGCTELSSCAGSPPQSSFHARSLLLSSVRSSRSSRSS